ncbi:hypothetical protein G6F56_000017 [Rhizopus delemar]|nr:hypothetical protein G6F56_000017 [Rhizopus delemar]
MNSFILGYFLGGITFIPLFIIIAYIIHFISRFIHNYNPKQSIENDKDNVNHQLHKAGWLRVYKDDIVDDNSIPSIGDMVVSYISGNSNDQNNNLYFLVIKYNTVYLYDSEKQLDCKEVITLNDYKVSIHPPGLPDAELFCKAQHIKLENSKQTYYINCNRCIDKEDWYFSFIRASKLALPGMSIQQDTTHFEQASMNHLINIVHSDEHHFQTQWLNAILGRAFLSIYRTQETKDALYKKIVSKLDKINAKRPPFLGEITVRSVDPGRSVPRITQPKLLGISPSGELSAEANLHYDGCVRIEIETVLEWKYSDLLPPFTIDIILAITLEEIEGKVLLKLKEHPTNRFWYAFEDQPKMKWKVEPVVWEKRVGYSVVVKAIETKIQEFIAETMVLPNFDDLVFFPTEGTGGIFQHPPNNSQLKDDRQEDEYFLTTAKSLPELFQQRTLAESECDISLSSEDTSLCSTSPTSTIDDPFQTVDSKNSSDIHITYSKENPTAERIRLRKSSSLALLNSQKTSASTAINVSPALAHKDKKDLDQKSIKSF